MTDRAERGVLPEELGATLIAEGLSTSQCLLGEIYSTDITICGDRIGSICSAAELSNVPLIDCEGMFAVPGLIDVRMHTETTFRVRGNLLGLSFRSEPLHCSSIPPTRLDAGGLAAITELEASL